MSGPTLSPVSSLCLVWVPSQYGNYRTRVKVGIKRPHVDLQIERCTTNSTAKTYLSTSPTSTENFLLSDLFNIHCVNNFGRILLDFKIDFSFIFSRRLRTATCGSRTEGPVGQVPCSSYKPKKWSQWEPFANCSNTKITHCKLMHKSSPHLHSLLPLGIIGMVNFTEVY